VMKLTKDGIRLVMICKLCPEQYIAYDENGLRVAYAQLRHGYFCVKGIGAWGTVLYEAYPNGDGMFEDDERDHFLDEAIRAIRSYCLRRRTGWS